MKQFGLYWRLMRFPQPIGIYLLWFPTAWALWLAFNGHPPFAMLLIFLLGTIVMRAAGCVVNDIADRHVDKFVSRTQHRPLTSGDVTLRQAISLLFFLLSIALLILLQLPVRCFYAAVPALVLTFIYPFCKRFFHAPQAVLGLAFSMAIPMVYLAANHPFDHFFYLLMLINTLWIIAYDTQYAMADREDDVKLGVHSTAVLLAHFDRLVIGLLQLSFHLLWLLFPLSHLGLLMWGFAGIVLISQQIAIRQRQPEHCIIAFKQNAIYGLFMWCALINS